MKYNDKNIERIVWKLLKLMPKSLKVKKKIIQDFENLKDILEIDNDE